MVGPRDTRVAAAGFALLFAGMAVLVARGAVGGLDQQAVDHLMPGLSSHSRAVSFLDGLLPFRLTDQSGRLIRIASQLVTLPAAAVPSVALVSLCVWVLWRRAADRIAALVAFAFGAANLAEIVVKHLLVRPDLYLHTRDDGPFLLHGFDSSYPSGHMLRAVLVAAAVALNWPRLTSWLCAWCGLAAIMLEVAGYHTPSDIAGGLVLGALTIALVVHAHRRWGGSQLECPGQEAIRQHS